MSAAAGRGVEHYLAIDQGGHATRAVVFGPAGRPVARSECPVGERRPAPDRVEQDPDEIAASVVTVVESCLREVPRASPVRAGMATQRSSVVCWDAASGEPLTPVLSWQDRRGAPLLEPLAARAEDVRRRTGLFLSPHYGASKLRWCLDHVDRVRDALAAGRLACGPLASFLAFRLLRGRPRLADPANASRTLLWSLGRVDWDPDLLELFGVPLRVLPACVPSRYAFGTLTAGAVPLDVLTGDQSAAIFAQGPPEETTVYLNLGTGAFAQRILGFRPRPAPGMLTGVAFRGEAGGVVYTREGTVNGAGSALAWAAEQLGVAAHGPRVEDWLDRDAEVPLFVNGISGLGSPWWVADLPSRFVGGGRPWQKIVAVVESVAFLVAVNLERMAAEGPVERVIATGGLASSDGLCRRLADLTGVPVERPSEREATARGLARLVAAHPPWEPLPADRFDPRERPALRRRFERWRRELSRALDRRAQGEGGRVGEGPARG